MMGFDTLHLEEKFLKKWPTLKPQNPLGLLLSPAIPYSLKELNLFIYVGYFHFYTESWLFQILTGNTKIS